MHCARASVLCCWACVVSERIQGSVWLGKRVCSGGANTVHGVLSRFVGRIQSADTRGRALSLASQTLTEPTFAPSSYLSFPRCLFSIPLPITRGFPLLRVENSAATPSPRPTTCTFAPVYLPSCTPLCPPVYLPTSLRPVCPPARNPPPPTFLISSTNRPTPPTTSPQKKASPPLPRLSPRRLIPAPPATGPAGHSRPVPACTSDPTPGL